MICSFPVMSVSFFPMYSAQHCIPYVLSILGSSKSMDVTRRQGDLMLHSPRDCKHWATPSDHCPFLGCSASPHTNTSCKGQLPEHLLQLQQLQQGRPTAASLQADVRTSDCWLYFFRLMSEPVPFGAVLSVSNVCVLCNVHYSPIHWCTGR